MRKRGIFKIWYGWAWLKAEGSVIWKAFWDKETPMSARMAALALIAYVVSPIDLIPDFIPFLGWIDDLIVIPVGMMMIRNMLPEEVWLRAGGVIAQPGGKTLRDVTPRFRGRKAARAR